MPARSGSATLPLHYGKVPAWLHVRMAALGRVIVEAIVLRYGRDELLRRLSHPQWFQSLGAVMGMDWHSSGITTTVIGALKRGLEPVRWELGLHVCGGRGAESRKTPGELVEIGQRTGVDGEALARASRLVAKVDGAAVQDGYELYLHGFVVTDDGKWTVVQQGMSPARKEARRYHWLSEGLSSFVDAPHAAIDGPPRVENIVNLTDHRAARSRDAQVELARQGPEAVVRAIVRAKSAVLPQLSLPAHHEVTASDVLMRRLAGAIAAAQARGPIDFADLLLTPGVGARTVLSLAMVAEVVHGAPCRFSDPARHSLAHGGKDGHPYPVPLAVYDETLRVMKRAIEAAKIGQSDKLWAIERLDREARRLERTAEVPEFDRFVATERAKSAEYDGWTVQGPVKRPKIPRGQLRLFARARRGSQ